MAAAFVVLTVFPERRSQFIVIGWPAALVLLIFLVILTPILSIFYRRLPFYVKPLAILFYAFKYLLLFYVLVHYFLPLVTLETESILALILARMDTHIETSLEVIAESGGILATVAGVVAGGLWVIGEVLGLILVLILIPLLAIVLLKGLQYALDRLVKYLLDRQLADLSPYATADTLWQGEMDEEGRGLPDTPLPEEETPYEPVPDREELPAGAQAIQESEPRRGDRGKRAAAVPAAVGGAFGSLGARIASLAKKAGARIKETASTLLAGLKERRKKQPVRKSRIRLPGTNPKKDKKEDPSGDHLQEDA